MFFDMYSMQPLNQLFSDFKLFQENKCIQLSIVSYSLKDDLHCLQCTSVTSTLHILNMFSSPSNSGVLGGWPQFPPNMTSITAAHGDPNEYHLIEGL